jgi:biopolymer transport protein ExbD
MSRALLLLLFALPAVADVEYAKLKAGQALPAETLRNEFSIFIRDGGDLLLATNEKITLRALGGRLNQARAEFDKRVPARRMGISELPVILHVDRNAPWFHVQLVLAEVAKARCPRVWFAVDAGGVKYVNAHLPMDLVRPGQDAVFLMVNVALLPTKSQKRKWPGGGVVKQPTAISYSFDGVGALGAAEARTVATAMSLGQGKSVIVRAVLAPAPPVPFRLVVEAMQLFDRKRYRSIEFVAPGKFDFPAPLPYPPWDRLDPSIVHGIGDPVRAAEADPETRPFKGGVIDPGVLLPLAPAGVPDREPDRKGRTVVNLTGDGRIHVQHLQLSLRAFLYFLAADAYPDHSALPPRVLLRVDGSAPWLHVTHLLTALSRRGFENVEIAVRRRAELRDPARDALTFGVPQDKDGPHAAMFQLKLLQAAANSAGEGSLQAVRTVRRDTLEMVAEREVESTFGPDNAPAARPLNVRFVWNGKSTYSFLQLVRWIHEQRAAQLQQRSFWRTKRLRVVASISEKVPARFAIAILARLKEMGWSEFYCFERLEQEDREFARRLAMPYPKTNRPLRGDDGLGQLPVPTSHPGSSSGPR